LRTLSPDEELRLGVPGFETPPADGGLRTTGLLAAGVPEETTARISTCCSREQIGQFVTRRLWRQKVGTVDQKSLHAAHPADVADS
jgi:hypothetical protein